MAIKSRHLYGQDKKAAILEIPFLCATTRCGRGGTSERTKISRLHSLPIPPQDKNHVLKQARKRAIKRESLRVKHHPSYINTKNKRTLPLASGEVKSLSIASREKHTEGRKEVYLPYRD